VEKGSKATPQLQEQQQQQAGVLSQQLADAVWGEVAGGLSGFEGLLGQYQHAALAAVDGSAGLCGSPAADSYEDVAWRAFARTRKKQQLGLG
jgi:hypothetical protein